MIFTRRFGALAARPQFPDAPELQQDLDLDLELREYLERSHLERKDREDLETADESAA